MIIYKKIIDINNYLCVLGSLVKVSKNIWYFGDNECKYKINCYDINKEYNVRIS